jgi:hypothetical protein
MQVTTSPALNWCIDSSPNFTIPQGAMVCGDCDKMGDMIGFFCWRVDKQDAELLPGVIGGGYLGVIAVLIES